MSQSNLANWCLFERSTINGWVRFFQTRHIWLLSLRYRNPARQSPPNSLYPHPQMSRQSNFSCRRNSAHKFYHPTKGSDSFIHPHIPGTKTESPFQIVDALGPASRNARKRCRQSCTVGREIFSFSAMSWLHVPCPAMRIIRAR